MSDSGWLIRRVVTWGASVIWMLPVLSFLAAGVPAPGADLPAVIVDWTVPLVEVQRLDDGTVAVTVEGYAQTAIPGAPRLPFTSTLIAIPPGASPSLRILTLEESVVPLPGPLAVSPRPEGVVRDQAGQPVGGAFAPATKALAGPTAPLAMEEAGIVRGVRLARVTFYPALAAGNRLRVIRHIRAEVIMERAEGLPEGSPARPSAQDPLLEVVRRAVLNPQDAIPAIMPNPKGLSTAPAGGPTEAFLEVRAPGLYRVTYEDLRAQGLEAVNPNHLRLFRDDDEVLLEWQGDDDATFEPGEALFFYAEPRFSRWTAADVYRLVLADTGSSRMNTRSASPVGLPAGTVWVEQTFEENREYTPDRFSPGIPPGRDGDRWVWNYQAGPATTSVTYTFPLAAVDPGAPATLTLWFIGFTAGDHRWSVGVNGATVGEAVWHGKTVVTVTLSIPPGVLRSGANGLSLRPLLTEGAWLDAFAVRYVRGPEPAGTSVAFGVTASPLPPGTLPSLPHRLYLPLILRNVQPGARAYTVSLAASGPYRAYDITDPLRPVRLTGFTVNGQSVTLGDPPEGGPRRYLVIAEEAIRAPDRIRPRADLWGFNLAGGFTGAEYLVITHPAFAGALEPLLNLRRSQGLSVAVVNVLGIYDAYGDGRPDPEAIHRFIADAYTTWNPRPVYVLLVGDGSYDPRQYRSGSPPTFIPPYLADVDPWGGETAADNRYACVEGSDVLPDLLLGRLPVDSLAEAQAAVQKVVAYEGAPFPGGWNARVLLVADDPDMAGDFPALTDAHAAVYVTPPFTVTRRYCAGNSPAVSDCGEAAQIHTALQGDWDAGALIVGFTGHSSWQQWAAERFFHLDDLPGLRNDRRLPVVAEMTCFTGAFHRPEPTLDEELVVRAGGGAVAAWGPTGLGVGTGHRYLSDGFFRAVFNDGVNSVGEAALAGKLALATTGLYPDLLDTFTLLGDPAQRFQRSIVPWAQAVYLPLIQRGFR